MSEATFKRMFNEVRSDINDLQLHDRIFSGVVENLARHPRLEQNFPAFFATFCASMRTYLIIGLGRVYDPEGTGHESCTLGRCLCALRDNPQFFSDGAITARLSEIWRKTYPNYLSSHRLDSQRIKTDIEKITESRKRLIPLRHKVYAHKDLETVLSEKRDAFLSSHDEVKQLILLAHDMWNYYSNIWNATLCSDKIHGEDDYKLLFSYLCQGMKIE